MEGKEYNSFNDLFVLCFKCEGDGLDVIDSFPDQTIPHCLHYT